MTDAEEGDAGASHERPTFHALSATIITRRKFGRHGERLRQTHRCVPLHNVAELVVNVILRAAQQNAAIIKKLRLGMLIATALSFLVRVFFQRGTLSPRKFSFWVYVLSLVPSTFLSRYLERIGSPRHDPTTGTLISAGEDLGRSGILEWCFDVVYITCE